MLVRMLTDRMDMVRGLALQGEVVELPDDEARRLLAARQAEPAEPEAAAVEPEEHAAQRRPTRRK